ncbi:UPF0236 family protein [Caldibacillus debilis]|uniref:Uncharacterized protein family (UPF0236) n=1 Tax=Caldibacillus debilis GB1 TaxID=1339248 RepID=A0A420VIU9_9BACI|nr:UPF0236 family protein [Caldibacillus debilis]RKO63460.1 Uncharacterized protein family (UPF0236) [Caldibacillus debilis GB1]
MDQQIAEERDKKRFRLLDKRKLQIVSLFDEIEVKRNYCRDRKTGEYVYLLDRYLNFEGTGTFSPLTEEAAIELAIQGPSDRKAARTLETLLGYRVISHETIRKHLLEVSGFPNGNPCTSLFSLWKWTAFMSNIKGEGKRERKSKSPLFIRDGKSTGNG